MRTLAAFRFKPDRAVQHPRHALHDRKPEPESARNSGTLIKAVEFDKYVAPFGLRNADARIVNVDTQMGALPTAANQDPALGRVFDCIGDEVLDQTAQQAPVGPHDQSARNNDEIDALRRRKGSKFEFDLTHQFIDTEAREFRPQGAGVEPGQRVAEAPLGCFADALADLDRRLAGPGEAGPS